MTRAVSLWSRLAKDRPILIPKFHYLQKAIPVKKILKEIIISVVFFVVVFSILDYVGMFNIYDEPGITKISCAVFFAMLLQFICATLFFEME